MGAERLTFGQIFILRLETSLIRSNCTEKLCNTTPGTWKSRFLPIWAQFGSYKAYFRPIGIERLTFGHPNLDEKQG